jgi:hypothetical protein
MGNWLFHSTWLFYKKILDAKRLDYQKCNVWLVHFQKLMTKMGTTAPEEQEKKPDQWRTFRKHFRRNLLPIVCCSFVFFWCGLAIMMIMIYSKFIYELPGTQLIISDGRHHKHYQKTRAVTGKIMACNIVVFVCEINSWRRSHKISCFVTMRQRFDRLTDFHEQGIICEVSYIALRSVRSISN